MTKGLFADSEFNSKLCRTMTPIALQNLMLASVAAADAVMLGRMEQNAMAAVSLATQVQFVQNIIVSSVTSTAGILGAQYWGRKSGRAINDIFCMALRLVTLISLAFSLACLFCPGILMAFFTNDAVLAEIGCRYLKIAGISYLFTGLSQCYQTTMKVTDHVSRVAWISSSTVVINILLNAVFIFGLFGLPAMGVRGAALATLLARLIEFVWSLVSSCQRGFLRPDYRRLFFHDVDLSRDFAKIAFPMLGAFLLWGIGFTSYTAILGHLGQDAAAANSVAAVIRDLTCCVANGVSAAAGIMVGNELGAGNLEKGKLWGIKLMKISYIIGLSVTVLILLLTWPVASFMSLTDAARTDLVAMMVILAFYMIGRCVNTIIINGIFDGGGDTLFDMYSLAVCMWGIAIPTALLGAFVFHWNAPAVFACTCLDEVGKIPWVMAHFYRFKWVKDLTRDREENKGL
ncbi:MAG: MATE family efflux transporter [Treponema sp.]|nr:MATE family efflux transporter [Treponema sp.]